jgi:CubicO group peptidase (beta-lactamase class C family)
MRNDCSPLIANGCRTSFGRVLDQIAEAMDRRDVPALQLHLSVREPALSLDAVAGRATCGKMTTGTRHRLWCQIKPVVGMLAAKLAEDSGWPPDVPISELGVEHQFIPVSEITLSDVLSHRTPYWRPGAGHIMVTPPGARAGLFSEIGRPGYHFAATQTYSEYVTWELLSESIHRLTGAPASVHLQNELDSSGIGIIVAPTDDQLAHWEDSVGCYYDLDCKDQVPFLHDLAPSIASDFIAGASGYGSMRQLGRWGDGLLDALRGEVSRLPSLIPSPAYVAALADRARGTRYDVALDATIDAACGMLHGDLSALKFGERPSHHAYAQMGWSYSSWMLIDPVPGLVLCVLTNAVTSTRGHWDSLRERLVTAAYDDIACAAASE